MADQFDTANATVQAQKLALLRSIAANGSQGAKDYQAAQADLQAQKAQAIADAVAAAKSRGAPEAASAGITAKIAPGYDLQQTNLAGAAASRQQNYLGMRQANANYMNEAAAAIPALREITNQKRQALEAQAASDAQDRALRLQLGQMQLQKAQDKTQTPSQIVSAGGGEDFLTKQIEENLVDNGGTMTADQIDKQLGLPSGYAQHLADRAQAARQTVSDKNMAANQKSPSNLPDETLAKKAGLPGSQVVQQIRQSPAYQTGAAAAAAGPANNRTLNDLKDMLLLQFPNDPATARLILAEYGPLYHN